MKFIALLFLIMIFLLVGCDDAEIDDFDDTEDVYASILPLNDIEIPREVEYFLFTHENMPRMAGSPATQALADALASIVLGESRENVSAPVYFTRTTQAFRRLAAGEVDILLVSEPLPSTLEELRSLGLDTIIAPIATDALVFIVCASNPVDNLTSEQLTLIYTGVITNWQEVGGDDVPITAFQRNEEAASQILMEKLVMDWSPMASPPVQAHSPEFGYYFPITAIRGFDSSPGAIGFTLLRTAETIDMADGFKILSIDGVHPDRNSIMTGDYPFLNHYYAVINAEESEDNPARIMFNWLLSTAGQLFIDSEGYVSMLNSPALGYETPSQSEMIWAVVTDFSALTPYTATISNFAGFRDTPLTLFTPASDYGVLLPYAGAVTLNDGSMQIAGFGLVTTDGVVVTNLVYDNVVRAVYNSEVGSEPRPAYSLHKILPVYDDTGHWFASLQAVVALDGSWVTPFDYVDVVFSDEVIFLIREYDSFNIDVINYYGQHLYNMLDLEWIYRLSENYWADILLYNVSEGFVFVALYDGSFGLVDVLTGELRETEFYGALRFSEGLAAVLPTRGEYGRWGFVNTMLEMVIEPQFIEPAVFRNGRTTVITEDGDEHIMNTAGEFLFSVSDGYFIIPHSDFSGFSVSSIVVWDDPQLFTNDFVEVMSPRGATLLGAESAIEFLGGGWYTLLSEEGSWVFNGETEILLPNNRYVVEVVGNYIIFSEPGPLFGQTFLGVMSVDGRDLIAPSDALSITAVVDNGDVLAFILNSNTLHVQFVQEYYTPAVYRLYDNYGNLIKTDLGVLRHNEAIGLLYVVGTNYFAWLELSGNVIMSIPFMGFSFD